MKTRIFTTIVFGLRIMITRKQIQDCVAFCEEQGYFIEESDIAYLLINREFRDRYKAYELTKSKDMPDEYVDDYDSSDKIACLRQYMNEHWAKRKESVINTESIEGAITFEENRDALIRYLGEIQKLMDEKKIEPKDGMKMMTDIRLKLNDKFNIKEAQVEQRIIVQPKFNYVCQYTHKECWLMTEEWAKKQYHLIKDPNWKEE